MGLSGRKTKQRIGADPRNLTWADNAAKFGQSYLSKLGWDPSKGLGANQDGRTSHIQVAQKLNMLGIGAGAPQGPDAIAWKQNRDYELLLKRLNDANKSEEGEKTVEGEGKDVKMEESELGADAGQKRKREEESGTEVGDDERKREKKRIKKEKKEKANKKEKRSKSTALTPEPSEQDDKKSKISSSSIVSQGTNTSSTPIARRPLAHRARFLRSKQLASQSSTAVAEILGISPSVSGSATPTVDGPSLSGRTSSTLTPTTLDESIKMEQLTKSTKSVADYFKEKLASRTKSASGTTTLVASSSSLPDVKKEGTDTNRDEEYPPARFGIGASRLAKEEGEPPRSGLGSGLKFGNLMGGLGMNFPSFAPSGSTVPSAKVEADVVKLEEPESEELQMERKSKKDKKDKKKDSKSKKGKESAISESASDGDDNERIAGVDVTGEAESKVDRKERKRKEKEERKAKEKKRKDKYSS